MFYNLPKNISMAIYSKPVIKADKPQKKSNKKEKDQEPDTERPTHAIKSLPVKEKKPLTEKQIAGRAKAAETRKLKKAAAQKELEDKIKQYEDEIAKKEKELVTKESNRKKSKTPITVPKQEGGIRKPKEKRKIADTDTLVQSPSSPVVPEKPKRVRKNPSPKQTPANSPQPAFMRKLAATHIEEKVRDSGVAKTQREIKTEAKELANQLWNTPRIQKTVQNSNDEYLNKMYAMIFPKRKSRS